MGVGRVGGSGLRAAMIGKEGGGADPPKFRKMLGQVLDFFCWRVGRSKKLAGLRFIWV